jgi:adenylate kinase family enzyme
VSTLIVTGPPGAGKTTVARLLAERAPASVCLDADGFFHAIRRGYVLPWQEEANEQNRTVLSALAAAARTYAAGGYQVVVDGIVGPWFLPLFADAFSAERLPLHYVVLRPARETALARAIVRSGDALTDEGPVDHMHRAFTRLGAYEAHVIDNGMLDPEHTAERIEAGMADGLLLVR